MLRKVSLNLEILKPGTGEETLIRSVAVELASLQGEYRLA